MDNPDVAARIAGEVKEYILDILRAGTLPINIRCKNIEAIVREELGQFGNSNFREWAIRCVKACKTTPNPEGIEKLIKLAVACTFTDDCDEGYQIWKDRVIELQLYAREALAECGITSEET